MTTPDNMSLSRAFDIVYELADQNVIEYNPTDNNEQYAENKNEYDKQRKALDIVHDFIINHIHNSNKIIFDRCHALLHTDNTQ